MVPIFDSVEEGGCEYPVLLRIFQLTTLQRPVTSTCVEGFNLGWVAHYQSPDGEAHVQLVARDAKAPNDSVISVHVGSGVEEAYEEAKRRGFEIVYPLTEESWGLRRFFVRAPDGNVINITSHSDE